MARVALTIALVLCATASLAQQAGLPTDASPGPSPTTATTNTMTMTTNTMTSPTSPTTTTTSTTEPEEKARLRTDYDGLHLIVPEEQDVYVDVGETFSMGFTELVGHVETNARAIEDLTESTAAELSAAVMALKSSAADQATEFNSALEAASSEITAQVSELASTTESSFASTQDDITAVGSVAAAQLGAAQTAMTNALGSTAVAINADASTQHNQLNGVIGQISSFAQSVSSDSSTAISQLLAENSVLRKDLSTLAANQLTPTILEEKYGITERPDLQKGQCANMQIWVIWLEHAHNGGLGGIDGVDAKCQEEAQRYGYRNTNGFGEWFGLMCVSQPAERNNVRDYVKSEYRGRPVYTTGGRLLQSSWNALMSGSGSMNTIPYSFANRVVDEGYAVNGPDWGDADGWTGCNSGGVLSSGLTCNDWTSSSSGVQGRNTEVDARQMFREETHGCADNYAVPCIGFRNC